MCTHFHGLTRIHSGSEFSDEEIQRRYTAYYGDKNVLTAGQIKGYRKKWEDLSEYMKDIKQTFARYYNKKHQRKGFFWGERFKSVLVDNGETLINCLAYIDLNPMRAGLVKKPEAYRWNSIGYHIQTNNKDDFLSLDFGLEEFGLRDSEARLEHYRRFLYVKGGLATLAVDGSLEGTDLTEMDRFLYRTRYFTDSGIIGSKAFVEKNYLTFKHHFSCKNKKIPKSIKGLQGIYSLKKLVESI